jgi:tetratricopeptide (TPR) repeat protein
MNISRITTWFIIIGSLWYSGCASYRVTLQGVDLERLAPSQPARRSASLAAYHNDLGVLLERKGELEGALEQYRLARKEDPALAIAAVNAGNVWVKLNNLNQAIISYQNALEIEPDQPRALNNLAWVYLIQGEEISLAIDLLRRAIAADPDHPYLYRDSLGWAFYLDGQTEKARGILQSALKETPAEETYLLSETHYHIGRIHYSQGNYDQAESHLEKSFSLNPTGEREKEIREIIELLKRER